MGAMNRLRFARPRLECLLALGLALLAVVANVPSEPTPGLVNVFARKTTSLNGAWHYIVDPYDTGYFDYRRKAYDEAARPGGGYFLDHKPKDKSELVEYDFDESPTLNVPGDWNSQDPKLFYYEGSVWYRRKFDVANGDPDRRLFLYFGAANYEADIYLNGRKLGKHVGGFTPFWYEVTGKAKDTGNSLVVRVNNVRHLDGVPTVNTDWWNYGGLTREVLLVETPATFISDFSVRLNPGARDHIEATVTLDGPRKEQVVKISLPALGVSAEQRTSSGGTARLELSAPNLPLWSPQKPALQEVRIACDTDETRDRIGFRTIATRGTNVLLNDQPVFLRGICIHEENPLRGGRAWSEEDARLLLGWAKDLNCNFVRLAHYPHNEHMARVADELGIMVWEEIPVYWTIQWTNAQTLQLAEDQLKSVIARDRNRASVVVWSVANETPVGPERTKFLKALVDTARSLDPTRLVSAAMEVRSDPANGDHKIVDDPFGEYPDLLSFNQYVGWYDGSPAKLERLTWTLKYQKPVFISEFGADALQGMHGDVTARFTEEYQEDLYRKTLLMLQKIPGFSGVTPWILCDFRSPRRALPRIQDGWNRKGLIGQNGEQKKAFAVLKEFYQEMEKRR
jgi:beta-glucuronidase